MAVHRFIFRLDFPLNYKLVDAPGRVMELLAEGGGEFWENIHDSQKDRKIGARRAIGSPVSEQRDISVQPNVLVASMESVAGVEVNAFLANESVSTIFRLVESIAEEFDLHQFNRVGVRFFYLADRGAFEGVFDSLKLRLNGGIVNAISDSLGQIRDIGYGFDGGADERSKYHLKFGPFESSELLRKAHFDHIGEALTSDSKASFILDADLYEENFSMKGRRPKNWVKGQIANFEELLARLDVALRN